MSIIIETERLVLRELNTSDSENFFQLNSNPNVMRYTGDQPFSSISEAELFLANYKDYEINGFGRWAVINKENGDFLGWCGLKLNEEKFIDLGFRFFEKVWKKGYATEAAKASIETGFNKLNMEEIIGRAALDNIASVKVLEKVGMNYWKNDACKGIENSVYYRISKTQHRTINLNI